MTLGIEPDDFFGLYYPNREKGRDKLYFLVEAHTGQMPQRRKTFNQTAVFLKYLIYLRTLKNKSHIKRFNINNFRVIFYTPVTAILKNMIDANKKVNDGLGSRLFLFTDQASFLENDPLEMLWQNGRDDNPRPLVSD